MNKQLKAMRKEVTSLSYLYEISMQPYSHTKKIRLSPSLGNDEDANGAWANCVKAYEDDSE